MCSFEHLRAQTDSCPVCQSSEHHTCPYHDGTCLAACCCTPPLPHRLACTPGDRTMLHPFDLSQLRSCMAPPSSHAMHTPVPTGLRQQGPLPLPLPQLPGQGGLQVGAQNNGAQVCWQQGHGDRTHCACAHQHAWCSYHT